MSAYHFTLTTNFQIVWVGIQATEQVPDVDCTAIIQMDYCTGQIGSWQLGHSIYTLYCGDNHNTANSPPAVQGSYGKATPKTARQGRGRPALGHTSV